MKQVLNIIGLLVVASSLRAAAPEERSWQLKLTDQPSGSFTETTTRLPDGKVVTREVMAMELNRLGNKVEMKVEGESTEDAQGQLQVLDSSVSNSKSATKLRATRDGDAFQIETKAGEKSYQKRVPTNGAVLGPKGVEKLSREQLKKPGDTIAFQMFLAELAGVRTVTRKAVTLVDDQGRQMVQIEETVEGMPGKQLLTLDENGRWVTRRQTLPFGELTMQPASDAAVAATNAAPPQPGNTLPAESYDSTMARSNILLPDPRTVTVVKLKLRHKKPELGWPDLASTTQRVLETSETFQVVEVRSFTPPSRPKDAPKAAAPDPSYLQPNALVQSDDPEVIRIAKEATSGATRDFEKARRLQDWVSRNLQFDLGIALAPASEVARNRRGTCIAYSTLLAALQRAAGLPSRVVMGYGYANGIWGGHAWTEAFVDGQWVAFDAALYGPGTADAARLSFGSSAGDDQMIKLVAAGGQMYGAVDFQILSFTHNDRTNEVPENAQPFEATGNRYTNSWLGIVVEAPEGFRVTSTNAVFPDPTIVEMENGEGGKIRIGMSNLGADDSAAKKRLLASAGEVTLRPHVAGKFKGEAASTAQGTRFLWRKGNSLWSIAIDAERSNELLTQIATKWQWTQ